MSGAGAHLNDPDSRRSANSTVTARRDASGPRDVLPTMTGTPGAARSVGRCRFLVFDLRCEEGNHD